MKGESMATKAAVKERGILFSAPMVRAILEDRKTVTRRVVKPPKDADEWFLWDAWPGVIGINTAFGDGPSEPYQPGDCDKVIRCPYGQPGDRLWVRETWRIDSSSGFNGRTKEASIAYRAGGGKSFPCDDAQLNAATGDTYGWRPSIFMRRWMSRLSLEVVGVRAERVQEITEEDATAEGICEGRIDADEYGPERIGYMAGPDDGLSILQPTARKAFADLWDSINAARGFSWESNPFVWVVSFRRLTAPSPSPAASVPKG